jgi:transcriptional regulator with XRE-family HTH domain
MDLLKTKLQVQSRLNAKRADWTKISEDSGLSRRWLEYFASGRIVNPGVDTLARVAKALEME